MKSLLTSLWLFALLMCSSYANAQDTTFYRHLFEKVSDRSLAKSYSLVHYTSSDSQKAVETVYYLSGQIKQVTTYSNYKKREKHGDETMFYENKQLYSIQQFKNGKAEGTHLVYFPNNSIKREDFYVKNERTTEKCYALDGSDTAYYEFLKMPEYPGGDEKLVAFLASNVKYPAASKYKNIQGFLVVGFVVSEDGKISDLKVIRSLSEDTDAEALRVTSMIERFEPGMLDGKKVTMQYNLPFRFSLR